MGHFQQPAFHGGGDIQQSVELARQLKTLGADLIDCSSGGNLPQAKIPVGAEVYNGKNPRRSIDPASFYSFYKEPNGRFVSPLVHLL